MCAPNDPASPQTPTATDGLLDAFVMALASGQANDLTQMLHDDVVLVSDGGAKVRAARHPIVGCSRVARFLSGIVNNAAPAEVQLDYVQTNGQVALYVDVEGQAASLFALEPDDSGQKVRRIFVLRNPEKLTHLTTSSPNE